MTRTCPKCHANLASIPVYNGKLCCPKCGVLLSLGRADDRIQATPASRRADRESPAPKRSKALPIVLIGLALGLGLVVPLAIGGVGAYFYFQSPPPAETVASVPTEAPQNPVPPAPIDPAPAKEPIQPARAVGGDANTLPLQELKAATVYIRGERATMISMGSGFVVHAQGDTVYIATNHHVITPPTEKEIAGRPQRPQQPQQPPLGPPMPGRPMPRPPFGPRRPIGPRMPRRRIALDTPSRSSAFTLSAVFYSGTAKEQSVPVTVVGEDAANDLAVLRAVGVVEVPRPIDYQRTPALHETMPVVMFGFPFGELLDRKRKNPAITVTKGNISSLRGTGNEIDRVQLDLDVNPGNSGGPMVDERGALIGVTVSHIRNTRIGFAIPVPKLQRLLRRCL